MNWQRVGSIGIALGVVGAACSKRSESSGHHSEPIPGAFHGKYRQGPGTEVVIKAEQIQLWLHGITQAVFLNVQDGVPEGGTSYRFREATVFSSGGSGSCTGTMTLADGKLTFALNDDQKACKFFNRSFEPVRP